MGFDLMTESKKEPTIALLSRVLMVERGFDGCDLVPEPRPRHSPENHSWDQRRHAVFVQINEPLKGDWHLPGSDEVDQVKPNRRSRETASLPCGEWLELHRVANSQSRRAPSQEVSDAIELVHSVGKKWKSQKRVLLSPFYPREVSALDFSSPCSQR